MRYIFFFLLFLYNQVFADNFLNGRGLICKYGKNKNIYEAYLFYESKYVSKYLFLEKDLYRIRKNEKRNYTIRNNFIMIKPFIINLQNLDVIDTEFNKIIGNCHITTNHYEANTFMLDLKNQIQNSINTILKRENT